MIPPPDEHRICPRCGGKYAAAARFCSRDATRLPEPQRPQRPPGAAAADPWLERLIADRFRLTRLLGQGGYGAVYEALHEDSRRRAAVKLMHRLVCADADARARMRREAQILSSLAHPHIVKLQDYGHTPEGIPYLVLDYLEGDTLAAVLAQIGKLPPGRAVDIAQQIAEALVFLHERGVLHRDLKAENVMLQLRDGQPDHVTLVDFGVAKVLDAPALTRAGRQPGTLLYMPPEAFSAVPPGPAADLYALGVLLHQLLCGSAPFAQSGMALLLAKEQEVATPSQRDESLAIPAALDQLCRRLLSHDPAQRPTSTEVVAELQHIRMFLPRRSQGSLQLARTYLFPGPGLQGAATVLLPLAAQLDALSAAKERGGQKLLAHMNALLQSLPAGARDTERARLELEVRWQSMEALQQEEEEQGLRLALLEEELREARAQSDAQHEALRQRSLALSEALAALPRDAEERTPLLLQRRDVELREAALTAPQVDALDAEVRAGRELMLALRGRRDQELGQVARLLEALPCPPALLDLKTQIADLRAQLEASTAALARLLGRGAPVSEGRPLTRPPRRPVGSK